METTVNKAAGYHSMANVKAVKRIAGKSGTDMIGVPYAKNLSLQPSVNETPVYADDRKVLVRYTDNGYTGNIGFTPRDTGREQSAGMLMPVAGGMARTSARGTDRFDVYYEYTESMEGGGDRKVKNWLLNVSIGKPEENHSTDADSISFGDYVYPIVVFGDPALKDEAGALWEDESGMGTVITRIFALPGDDGYQTFAASVPKPIIVPEA